MSLYQHFVKSHLSKLMSTLGLDISYTKAKGDYLFYRNEYDEQIPVLDLLGGYGALIFGHNHPELLEHARNLLAEDLPIHSQFSLREHSGQLAEKLNSIVQRELADDEEFAVTFSNSGAEAVEAAIKHAELDRVLKLQSLLDEVTLNIEAVQKALRTGIAKVKEDFFAKTAAREAIFDVQSFEDLVVTLISHNAKMLAKRPVFLALEKSFHGKLVGTVQLTYNKNFRRPFQYLGLNTRFVKPNDAPSLDQIIDQERVTIFDLAIDDGYVQLIEREIPIFSGFLLEPIQGEGGINVLGSDFAKHIRKVCNINAMPLIIDEIQSGMGRTGSFLASTQIPIKGDYYTLSKSLGGGLAKIGATLIRRSHLRKEFSVIHSSTFAEDAYSSSIALKTLEMLESPEINAYAKAQVCGEKLKSVFLKLKDQFPSVIKDVRGLGLFLGVEFYPQDSASSILFRGSSYNDSFGYLLSGYLLHAERIRVAPPGSAPNVLRIEPSIFLTDHQIAHVERAFTKLCEIIEAQDALHLAFPLANSTRAKPRSEVVQFDTDFPVFKSEPQPAHITRPVRKVAFINHLINPELLAEVDPSLAELNSEELTAFVERMAPNKKTAPYPPVRIESPLGSAVDFYLYPLCVSSHQMVDYLTSGELDDIRSDIEDRIKDAKDQGCEVAGLGMYTSIVTNNCTSLRIPDMALTSGNALTIGMALDAIEQEVAKRELNADSLTTVIIGAAGNIASTYASLLSEQCSHIVLLGSHKNGSLNRVRKTAHTIYQDTWHELATHSREQWGVLAQKLADEHFIQQWLAGEAPKENIGKLIADALIEAHGEDPYITVSDDMQWLGKGDLVLCAANSAEPFIEAEQFKSQAIVCDIAVPNNVMSDVTIKRPDIIYQQGGVVATPNGESLHPTARAFLSQGELFACMAETAVLGLAGINQHYSYGVISKAQVKEISKLAKLHGFALSASKVGSSL